MARKPKITASDKATKALAKRMQDFAAANLEAQAAALPSSANIEVKRKSQKTELTARRVDAFDALKPSLDPGAYDAVRALERNMLIRARLGDRSAATQRIDCTSGPTSDLTLAAGERVDRVKANLSPRDWWLICDLLSSRKPWRDVVAYVTGESNEHAQAARVRAACVNLRDIREPRAAQRAA